MGEFHTFAQFLEKTKSCRTLFPFFIKGMVGCRYLLKVSKRFIWKWNLQKLKNILFQAKHWWWKHPLFDRHHHFRLCFNPFPPTLFRILMRVCSNILYLWALPVLIGRIKSSPLRAQELWKGTQIIKCLLQFIQEPDGEADAASWTKILIIDVTEKRPARRRWRNRLVIIFFI